ncbi:MAG TPA: Rrf2 family transcriptional regulator [Thermoguttaceae bacterium]|nr:Rrf2 family transcriptional regulator [Thermoguttaceae bacterium]
MNISEAVSLAIHTMAVLATNDRQRLRNQAIAELLGASGHHLAKVMQRLVKAGLVDSACGPQGGFLLGKPATKVSLLAIYEAIEGPLPDQMCLLNEPHCRGGCCILGQTLYSIHRQLRDYLHDTTLAELAATVSFSVASEDSTSES